MSPKLASFLVLLVIVVMQGADEALGASCSERIANLEKNHAAFAKSLDALKSQAATRQRCESGDEYIVLHNQAASIDFGERSSIQPPGTKGVKRHVTFSTPFNSVPKVMIGLSALDVSKAHNLRIMTVAINIQKDGFDIISSEWYYTVIYLSTVSWIACSD